MQKPKQPGRRAARFSPDFEHKKDFQPLARFDFGTFRFVCRNLAGISVVAHWGASVLVTGATIAELAS